MADGQVVPAPAVTEAPVWRSLAEAREARGWSVQEVASHLKLTVRQVQAMEEGAIEQLPGLAFARGFVRNYARLLDLDPARYLGALEPVQVSPQSLDSPMEDLGRLPGGSAIGRYPALPAAALTLALLVLVVCGWYFGWFEPREEASLADVVAQSEARAATGGDASAVLASAPVAASVVSAPVAAVSEPIAASAPAVQPATIAQSAPQAAVSAPLAAGEQRVRFNFSGDSWVEVRDNGGKVIFSRLNPAGSETEVQGAGPLSITIGNAAQVTATVNGKAFNIQPFIAAGKTVARFKLQ